jgi:hypothetical protein
LCCDRRTLVLDDVVDQNGHVVLDERVALIAEGLGRQSAHDLELLDDLGLGVVLLQVAIDVLRGRKRKIGNGGEKRRWSIVRSTRRQASQVEGIKEGSVGG